MSVTCAREGNGTLALNAGNQQLVPVNLNRIGLIISNFSGVVCNLVFGEGPSGVAPTATTTTGVQLASGGSLTLSGSLNFLGEIRVIGASGNIGWVEF